MSQLREHEGGRAGPDVVGAGELEIDQPSNNPGPRVLPQLYTGQRDNPSTRHYNLNIYPLNTGTHNFTKQILPNIKL